MTEKEEIEKLRRDVQFYSDKYFKLRGEFIELKTSSLKFKIKNKVDRIFSVLLVFLRCLQKQCGLGLVMDLN